MVAARNHLPHTIVGCPGPGADASPVTLPLNCSVDSPARTIPPGGGNRRAARLVAVSGRMPTRAAGAATMVTSSVTRIRRRRAVIFRLVRDGLPSGTKTISCGKNGVT